VIGEPRSRATTKERRRGALLLLLLLLGAFALGGLSVGFLRGQPSVAAQPTQTAPATSVPSDSVPSDSVAMPSASGSEKVGGVEVEPTGLGSGGNGAPVGGLNFTITGRSTSLMLGVSTPIRLTLANPNGLPISVTRLSVGIAADSTPPGCRSASNVRITQSSISDADAITVPANGSVTLTTPPHAPQITLLNLPDVNQDVCKNKTFYLTYTGTATYTASATGSPNQ
jgi:hypothetical protein